MVDNSGESDLSGESEEPDSPDERNPSDARARALFDCARDGEPGLAAIAGYDLIRRLGRGGMGAVYLIRHTETGRQAALKLMLPVTVSDHESRLRFLQEADFSARLKHPNIAALHTCGYFDGTFFFTLEYCPGGSLDQLLKERKGPLPVDEAVALIGQALEGLSYAHAEHVMHRDLSPHNILLADVPKISDFGLAKSFAQNGLSGFTHSDVTAGKPYFMPRQQAVNFKRSAPSVDLWAMAATLYYCLTGAYPRDFTPKRDLWLTILEKPAVPIRHRAPSLPEPLAEVIDYALTETPGFGFDTCAEFRQALNPWNGGGCGGPRP
jgi:eukaryotic-like serine/threonine-protein kinase